MKILDAKILQINVQNDHRGSFVKTFSSAKEESIAEFKISEVFYSKTNAGAGRGMHLQTEGSASNRLISCLDGKIFDVLLDLRSNSPTYLQIDTLEMTPSYLNSIYVPAGVAHGFIAMENSTTHYLSDRGYQPDLDLGVNIFSLGIELPVKEIRMSERDKKLPSLEEWISNQK